MLVKSIARAIVIPLAAAGLLWSCQPAAETSDFTATIVPKNSTVASDDGFTYVAITCKTQWNVELQYPEDGAKDWATMDPATGTGDKTDARLRYSQNEGDDARTVMLVLFSLGKQVATATVSQNGQSGQATVASGGVDVTAAGWLELPQTKAKDGCEFYTLDYEGKKYLNNKSSGVRNYSFYWKPSEHLSIWVAYPLNGTLHGNGKFPYDWENSLSSDLTSLVPLSTLPDITHASYGGNDFSGNSGSYWARGHQLPRADRQVSQIAVRSTCYPVNITPQDQGFNGGIWENLESRVRTIGDTSDTTYVVTGCVIEGSRAKTSSRSGFAINVPAAYFKAVLQKSTSVAVGHSGWRAAAWYLPHDNAIAKGSYNDYVMTVDALEQKLGYDLFVNLPTAVGQKLADEIEADCNWAK